MQVQLELHTEGKGTWEFKYIGSVRRNLRDVDVVLTDDVLVYVTERFKRN